MKNCCRSECRAKRCQAGDRQVPGRCQAPRYARYNTATVPFPTSTAETFTADETRALDPYFTNTDRPVFALRNLPETVKGALFARYSRSAKSVRRLFLDEFLGDLGAHATPDPIARTVSTRVC